ncbi:MAG TPA: 1-phosphofructokinase family hexose kinase [Streptosporangiaceae bacterium]|nr:1-phosphofructokinase family hexose kinase [Streptosporangiaceae bacterium]
MILVVTLNPALDVTHHVEQADWAGVNRPHTVMTRPGGKGVNVARVLLALGTGVLVTGLAGGAAGDAVRAGLDAAGVPADLTPIAAETRRTFAVVDAARGQTGLFNEPGPPVSEAEFARFRDRFRAALPAAAAVVLTGSLPRGLPASCYAELIALADGTPVVLDTDGPPLRDGAAAGPAIVKPNLAELERVAGRPLRAGPGAESAAPDEVRHAARELMTAGAAAVVVTLGPAGLLAETSDGTWRAVPPGPEPGNPTGAGDAAVAGLARGLALGQAWPERLRHATALGTAAVAAPVAGEFSRERYAELLPEISVRRDDDPAQPGAARPGAARPSPAPSPEGRP